MELLRPLFSEGDQLGRAKVDEILRRGDDVAPALEDILRDEANWEAEFPAGWAVVHAAHLLAALRRPASFEVLADVVEVAAAYEEEWILEAAPFYFAAYGPGILPRLRDVARDLDRSPTLRGVANEAVALLGHQHESVRAEALDVLRQSVDDLACDQDVRAFAGLALLDFAIPEDRGRIEAAIDNDILHYDDVEGIYRGGQRIPREPFDWMSFYDPEEIAARQEAAAEEEEEEEVEENPDAPPPPLKSAAVPGRNDPCPCGSRMKYKKCCGK
jgi:hypothetical protein